MSVYKKIFVSVHINKINAPALRNKMNVQHIEMK